MKKTFVVLFTIALALASCTKENDGKRLDTEVKASDPITFKLTASHPDATKAVKTGWEQGDAIFVFFDNVAAPRHLKMTFDGSAWTSAEYNGSTVSAGALGLQNGNSGNMLAVYLPFGCDATVAADGDSFVFNKTYYTYYATATLEYTVADNQVSGAFNMVIPEGYLQLFVPDASAADEAYELNCDAVIPTGIASISAAGVISETSTLYGDMPGYAYGSGADRGYVFSGKLKTDYYYDNTGGLGYYFAKTKVSDNTRQDYFVKKVEGRELTSHCAIKLPANDNVFVSSGSFAGKWVPVGSGITVKFGKIINGERHTYANFQTCNYGASRPEDMGTKLSYNDALALENETMSLPTNIQYQTIIDNCSWTLLSVHGSFGRVVVPEISANSEPGTEVPFGFIFLPITEPASHTGYLHYWSHNKEKDEQDNDTGKALYLNSGPWDIIARVYSADKANSYSVRYLIYKEI